MKATDELGSIELDPPGSPETRGLSYRQNGLGLYMVVREGGGHVPATLAGGYTRKRLVEAAIASYEAFLAKPKREYRRSRKWQEDKSKQ
jgi:hypothetical protein